MTYQIKFKATHPELMPEYKTEFSAGADIKAAEDAIIKPGETKIIKTGIFIESFEFDALLEIQIRARSSLAAKGILLANGVGTVDLDYPGEIGVILYNSNNPYLRAKDHKGALIIENFLIKRGDRIAQLVISEVIQTKQFAIGGKREGGFGSTGK